MRALAVIALALALSGPALAEDQADTMAYIASLKSQRTLALDAQALAEAKLEFMRAELAKAKAELAEIKKKLDEKVQPQPQQ